MSLCSAGSEPVTLLHENARLARTVINIMRALIISPPGFCLFLLSLRYS